ncbi:hypothetical protein K505DRAFT_285595 [Melanomma pulvis-pyrius CBS 109.77]|uniref:Uncharacterized protein n=1 Tax=Melanomma pulvis-pyrius CBS 109.77 TaxID=1314802 RepID=A0A6A6WXB0_9PLEO|nr:hypothetical protein K505DRAFT_285595 [Melanomma pulvis-pyrius CBS 109.77]
MLPAFQPSRPKPPQQRPQPSYAQQQQRATHELPHSPSLNSPLHPMSTPNPPKPRNQVEAMPPFTPTQAPFFPPRSFYDSAVRHPVFFTSQLRKPPFPIPEVASRGWSPVASGYIMESKKVEANSGPKTKL